MQRLFLGSEQEMSVQERLGKDSPSSEHCLKWIFAVNKMSWRRRRRDVPRAHLGQAQVDFGCLQNSLSSLTHFCRSQGPKKRKKKNPEIYSWPHKKKTPGRTERKPQAAEEREMLIFCR